ncbi:MAG: transposase [bacterium]
MRKRFTEEQIIRILNQGESGEKVKDIVREHGICEQTYYRWKSKYSGMEIKEIRRLKDLEAENKQLKRLVAEKELHILGLKTVLEKKF